MNLICPYCNHDHVEEVQEDPDTWISAEGPYETECAACFKEFVVHTIATYEFVTGRLGGNTQ